MNRNAAWLLEPLGAEAELVLAALTGTERPLRLNDLAAITELPTGHVGRHLRTLEAARLVRYASGTWAPSGRGARYAFPEGPPRGRVAV